MIYSETDYLSLNACWEAVPCHRNSNTWSPTIVKIFDDENKYMEYENIINLLGNL